MWLINSIVTLKICTHIDHCWSAQVFDACLTMGCNFLDAAQVYGFGKCEELLGNVISKQREKWIVATKCGIYANEDGMYFDASPDKVSSVD